jgi:hypothetical protein
VLLGAGLLMVAVGGLAILGTRGLVRELEAYTRP